jgi:ubiquitin carboxyl-terminal hydrolase 8
MNSILQCLSNTLKLTDYLISAKYNEDDQDKTFKRKPEYLFLISYVNLLNNVWESNQLLKPRLFNECLAKFIPKYKTYNQQDSHECLMYILDLLHTSLSYEVEVDIKGEIQTSSDALMKRSLESWKSFYEKKYSCIIETFSGLLYNNISCSSCDYQDDVFEPYNCLSIDLIPNGDSTLTECLDLFFKDQERIDTWSCSKCKQTGCLKNCKMWTLPNFFIIHLKRFSSTREKTHNLITFPIEDLDLTKYVSSDKQDPNNYIYSLYAVNYHSGDANGGHYWSSCRNLDNNWYLFNDGHVSRIHNNNELITKDAYILFYYRKMLS